MSTRRFVSIMVAALIVFTLVVGSVAIATAEEFTYQVDAVVVSWETTPLGDLEIEVVDEEGNLWGYFADADEDVRIGDVVTLTIFRFGEEAEEDDEIIDVIRVDHLDTLEIVQWLCH